MLLIGIMLLVFGFQWISTGLLGEIIAGLDEEIETKGTIATPFSHECPKTRVTVILNGVGQGSGLTRRATNTDVGEHTVTVTAHQPPTYPSIATTTVLIDVACNPTDPTYGPCCNSQGRYEPDGTSCTPHHPRAGASYACQAGACTEYCTPRVSTACHDGNIVYQDSCGRWGDVAAYCTDGHVCTNEGGAHCIA